MNRGEAYGSWGFVAEAPGVAAEGLARLSTNPQFAVIDRTGEPVAEFRDFDEAIAFFAISRAFGFVDTFATTAMLTPSQRARIGEVFA